MITTVVAVQLEARLIGRGSRGYLHKRNLRGKNFQFDLRLPLLTKKNPTR